MSAQNVVKIADLLIPRKKIESAKIKDSFGQTTKRSLFTSRYIQMAPCIINDTMHGAP
jgi:hypothetical protein